WCRTLAAMAHDSRMRAMASLFLIGMAISGGESGGLDDIEAERTVVSGDRAGGGERVGRKGGVERFVARFEPFVEHQGMEQRSREAREGETRIGFARPEPFSQKGEKSSVSDGEAALKRRPGRLAERGAARNLLPHQSGGRDVLKIQRTQPGHHVFRKGIGRTEEKEFDPGGIATEGKEARK